MQKINFHDQELKIINTQLNLAEKLLLIVWNKTFKSVPFILRPRLSETLKIAIIEDLKLRGKISIESSMISITDEHPTGDLLLDEMLSKLKANQDPFINQEMIQPVFDQLVNKEILVEKSAKLGRRYALKATGVREAIIENLKAFILGKADDKEAPILIALLADRIGVFMALPFKLVMPALGKRARLVSKAEIEGGLSLARPLSTMQRQEKEVNITSSSKDENAVRFDEINAKLEKVREEIQQLRQENKIEHAWGRAIDNRLEANLSARMDDYANMLTSKLDAQDELTDESFEALFDDLEKLKKKIDLSNALHPEELDKLYVMLEVTLRKAEPVVEKIKAETGFFFDENRIMLYSEKELRHKIKDLEKKLATSRNGLLTKQEEELFMKAEEIRQYLIMARDSIKIIDDARMVSPRLRAFYDFLDRHPAGKLFYKRAKTTMQAIPFVSILTSALRIEA